MTAQDYQAPDSVGRLQKTALMVGLLGLFACGILAMKSPENFFHSYLMSYLLVLGLTLGSLGLLMLQHLTGGQWGIVIRRPAEAAARTLWLVAILFVPVIVGMKYLYSGDSGEPGWLNAPRTGEGALPKFQQDYLTTHGIFGFYGRAVIYFAIWIGLMLIFNYWSGKQDRNRDDRALRRDFKLLAGPGIILYVFTMTFAAIDWVMSLSPHWASTIYGFLFVAGQIVSALSLMIAVVVMLARDEPLSGALQTRHVHDLGKLLLAFVMLWAYFDFSQLLIIWSGNQPEEITFYRTRLYGGWGAVAVVVLLFHFALPFFLLLSRELKRNSRLLQRVAMWMIFARLVDLFWMTRPEFTARALPTPLDLTVPAAVVGLWLAFFASMTCLVTRS
jgi:hypothetical protein